MLDMLLAIFNFQEHNQIEYCSNSCYRALIEDTDHHHSDNYTSFFSKLSKFLATRNYANETDQNKSFAKEYSLAFKTNLSQKHDQIEHQSLH